MENSRTVAVVIVAVLGQLLQEPFVVSKGTITGDPAAPEQFLFQKRLEQCRRQLGFGLEGDVLGNAALLTTLGPLGFKPALGQVKLALQQRVTFGAGVANKDAGLAIGRLAQRSAILRRHSN